MVALLCFIQEILPSRVLSVRLSAFTHSFKIFIATNPAQTIVILGQTISLRRAFT
jgi:hypothetical protein